MLINSLLGAFFYIFIGDRQESNARIHVGIVGSWIQVIILIGPADFGLHVWGNFSDFIKEKGAGR